MPNSISGLPALRCFIFFAADLIILVLPSFNRETLAKLGQGFVRICLFKVSPNREVVERTPGIVSYYGMVAKRNARIGCILIPAPTTTLSCRHPGRIWQKTPPNTFDKIFDKPQPPRVQWTQILAGMLTVLRFGPDFYGELQLIMRSLIAGAAPTPRKIRGAVMPDKMQQSSGVLFSTGVTGNYGKRRPLCTIISSGARHAPLDRVGLIRHRATFAACRFASAMIIAAGVGWIRKTLPRQQIGRGCGQRLQRWRTGDSGSAPSRVGFAGIIAIIGPAVCGLLAQGTT